MITSALPQPMSHERADARILASSGVGPAQPSAPRLSSRDLLGPAREVEIEHVTDADGVATATLGWQAVVPDAA